MATTMRAAVITGFGKPLAFQDWPIATPGPAKSWSRPRRAESGSTW